MLTTQEKTDIASFKTRRSRKKKSPRETQTSRNRVPSCSFFCFFLIGPRNKRKKKKHEKKKKIQTLKLMFHRCELQARTSEEDSGQLAPMQKARRRRRGLCGRFPQGGQLVDNWERWKNNFHG
jgi:hypothetical protein